MSHFLKVEERILAGPPDLVPFFWRVLRKSASDPETIALRAIKTEFEDIYVQMLTRYQALSLRDCPIEMPTIFKRVILRSLPIDVYSAWSNYSDYQKQYFEDRYFMLPVDDGRYKTVCELASAEKLSKYPDGSGDTLEDETDYVIYRGEVFFNENPFETTDKFTVLESPYTLRTPWGETISYKEMYLYGVTATLNEIPVSTHYGELVMDDAEIEYFEDRDDYALFVYSLFRVFYTGGTEESLQYFANVLAGSPVIGSDGERLQKIERVVHSSKSWNRITTNKGNYDIPYFITPSEWMVTGLDLKKDTPVGEFITINEYTKNPDWGNGEIAGTAAYLVHKSSCEFFPVLYDLETVFTHEEIEISDAMQKPRFDLMKPEYLGINEFHTGTHGLWHSIIGPEYLRFTFNDPSTSETIVSHFNFILQEVIPVDILYTVEIADEESDALKDHEGEALLDSEGEELLGTEEDSGDDLLDEDDEEVLDHEGEELLAT